MRFGSTINLLAKHVLKYDRILWPPEVACALQAHFQVPHGLACLFACAYMGGGYWDQCIQFACLFAAAYDFSTQTLSGWLAFVGLPILLGHCLGPLFGSASV